jgi:hypothetical protein
MKFAISAFIFLMLVWWYANEKDADIQRPLAVVIIILALPISLLLGVDAGKVVEQENPSQKFMRILGRLLQAPKIIIGVILIINSLVYPFFGVHELFYDISNNFTPIKHISFLIIALLGFGAGLTFIRDGLGLKEKVNKKMAKNPFGK